MPTLRIPTPLRPYTGGNAQLDLKSQSVSGALDELLAVHPELKPHLFTEGGELRAFVNLFVNDENVRDLQGNATPLKPEDTLMILPSIAGGAPPQQPMMTRDEVLRYSRHLLIPEVGLAGQQKLKAASVLVIGTGGLGSPVAMYLAAAGVGRIGLVDYDVVDFSNLQRQVIHGTSQIGVLKVESAKQRLLDLNPTVEVVTYNEPFTSDNALRIADGYDLIIDGTDNFPTRYLVNDVCAKLGIPNVYGSIFRFDGQVSIFDGSDANTPCYRCLFPEPPPPGLVPSCAEGGVLGVLPGIIGSLQASEGLKLILGIGEPLRGKLLLFNALDMRFDFVKLRKNPNCAVCSKPADQVELIDYEAFCGVPAHDHDEANVEDRFEVDVQKLSEEINGGKLIKLVDVREPHELQISHIEGAKLIPLGEVAARLSELDTAEEVVVFCRSGSRSARAVELMFTAGFRKVRNLRGGINAWAQQVDPSQPVY